MKEFDIERLHNSGLMPDWAYYQLNGRDAAENYMKQQQEKNKIDRGLEIYKRQRQEQIDDEIIKQIEAKLPPEIEKVIDSLLDGFQ